MRLSICVGSALLLATFPAMAAEPTGDWLVENGAAHIRIENCGGSLWGVTSWEKVPGKDTENPDPAKRNRPTLGIPILIDMKPAGDGSRWDGQVYNAENGKTYTANITLKDANTLRIQGCVLGFLCGGQDWTRVQPIATQGQAAPPAKSKDGKNASKGKGAASTICSNVPNLARATH